MAKLRTQFEELEAQMRLTKDRSEQDEILDRWLMLTEVSDEVQPLSHWAADPEMLMPRQREALEPKVIRRMRFIM